MKKTNTRTKSRLPHILSAIVGMLVISILLSSNALTPKPEGMVCAAGLPEEQLMTIQTHGDQTEGGLVKLFVVGDIMTSRTVGKRMRENGFGYPFLEMGSLMKSADMVFANLETPIAPGGPVGETSMSFRSDPGTEIALKEYNVGLVSLANNHTMNQGSDGLRTTMDLLDEAGIQYAGAGTTEKDAYAPQYRTINNVRLAFLAHNDEDVVPDSYRATDTKPGTAFMNEEKLKEGITEAKNFSDVIIVSMHSGTEYKQFPNDHQKEFAHAAIDAGADLVIGHHPHVVQTAEEYKGKMIFYSLGNFIFDQMWSEDTRQGLAMTMTLNKDGLLSTQLHPIKIHDFAQPRLIEDENEAKNLLNRLTFPYSGEEGAYTITTAKGEQVVATREHELQYQPEGDTDGDGLTDKEEREIYQTFWYDADTDGDGFADGEEVRSGFSPKQPAGVKMSHADTDNDGLNDAWEIALGSNLMVRDTDGDGYLDGTEVYFGYSPTNPQPEKLEKWIEVDVEKYEMYPYLGETRLETIKVSTGAPGWPTPRGTFSVQRMQESKDYGGADYFLPNTKWNLHFTTYQGWRYWIHGAYWHNLFGKKNVSHGCVNVHYDDIERIYGWSNVGMRVWVH